MQALVLADQNTWERDELAVLAESADCVLSLGDFIWGDLAPLSAVATKKMGVYGNHCHEDYLADLGFENLHLRTLEFGGLTFGGFQGCVRYKRGDGFMYSQGEAEQLLADFPRVDVMVCHAPPRSVHDVDNPTHSGFTALSTYCLQHHPRYLLHGHTYPTVVKKTDAGKSITTRLGQTEVIYVHGLQIVTL